MIRSPSSLHMSASPGGVGKKDKAGVIATALRTALWEKERLYFADPVS
jgi:hypothetical protein